MRMVLESLSILPSRPCLPVADSCSGVSSLLSEQSYEPTDGLLGTPLLSKVFSTIFLRTWSMVVGILFLIGKQKEKVLDEKGRWFLNCNK